MFRSYSLYSKCNNDVQWRGAFAKTNGMLFCKKIIEEGEWERVICAMRHFVEFQSRVIFPDFGSANAIKLCAIFPFYLLQYYDKIALHIVSGQPGPPDVANL